MFYLIPTQEFSLMSFMSKIKSAVTSTTAQQVEIVSILATTAYVAFADKLDPKNAAGLQGVFVAGALAGGLGTYASNKIAGTKGDIGWNAYRAAAAGALAYRASKFINPGVAVAMIEVTSDAGEFIGDVVSDTAGVIA